MVKKLVLLAFLAAPFLAAGCSNSDDDTSPGGGTITPPAGCNADSTLSCSGGSTGFACDIGSNPESEDSSLSCSDPNTDSNSEDDYCCFTGFTGSSTTCTPDDDVSLACADGTFGFSCVTGDDPTTYDATLVCSDSSDTGSGESDFCCVYGGTATGGDDDNGGGTPPTGCTVDTTLDCSGSGAIGYACTIGDNPEAEDDSLSCSDPNTDSNNEDDYCCFTGFTGSSTTCQPDDDVTLACDTGYGFSCVTGDDPTTYDASLTCSDSTDTEDGESLFCCTY
jgi:hypothetical protein